jgi:hypothetical protein
VLERSSLQPQADRPDTGRSAIVEAGRSELAAGTGNGVGEGISYLGRVVLGEEPDFGDLIPDDAEEGELRSLDPGALSRRVPTDHRGDLLRGRDHLSRSL